MRPLDAECAVEADLVWNLDLLLDGLPVIEMYGIVSGRVGFQKPNSPVRVFRFWFLYSGFCILKVRHGFLVSEKVFGFCGSNLGSAHSRRVGSSPVRRSKCNALKKKKTVGNG